MFDTITHEYESDVVAVTKEIEKTISPDKVTEMYKEVREQVENDIIASFKFESNQLNGVAIVFEDDFFTAGMRVLASYSLNGKKYTIKERIEGGISALNPDKIFDILYEQFKANIANELLRESVIKTKLFSKGSLL